MSQKIKSLLYFVCFMVSAAMYYGLEPTLDQNSNTVETVKMKKMDNNKLDSDKIASLEITE